MKYHYKYNQINEREGKKKGTTITMELIVTSV
jgi:hypothetical protein